jgi:hypothetical protein
LLELLCSESVLFCWQGKWLRLKEITTHQANSSGYGTTGVPILSCLDPSWVWIDWHSFLGSWLGIWEVQTFTSSILPQQGGECQGSERGWLRRQDCDQEDDRAAACGHNPLYLGTILRRVFRHYRDWPSHLQILSKTSGYEKVFSYFDLMLPRTCFLYSL